MLPKEDGDQVPSANYREDTETRILQSTRRLQGHVQDQFERRERHTHTLTHKHTDSLTHSHTHSLTHTHTCALYAQLKRALKASAAPALCFSL